QELCLLPATELRMRFANRELSPVEAADAILTEIDSVNPTINALVTGTSDPSRAQARRAARAYANNLAGPLAGIPISIKDLTLTKGIRTTRGSLLYKEWVPEENAPFMDRMYESGAVVLGKTNTPEFGWKGETTNRVVGASHNPWKHGLT